MRIVGRTFVLLYRKYNLKKNMISKEFFFQWISHVFGYYECLFNMNILFNMSVRTSNISCYVEYDPLTVGWAIVGMFVLYR
jgi:hypothetical protein